MAVNKSVYAVIGNIPAEYHSLDLRNYFSMFIEDQGFETFHFRHRPEIQRIENRDKCDEVRALTVQPLAGSSKDNADRKCSKTTCCVVKVKDSRLKDLIRMYDRKHWLDKNGDMLPTVCRITGISMSKPHREVADGASEIFKPAAVTGKYKTRKEQKAIPSDRETFTETDLEKLPELHPPDVMPHGNVGTPTETFLKFIKECRLPPNVINKLGLRFPRKKTNKIYSNVHFDYGHEPVENKLEREQGEEEVVTSASGFELCREGSNLQTATRSDDSKNKMFSGAGKHGNGQTNGSKSKAERKRQRKVSSSDEEKAQSESDSDDFEDWERHEALHSDVAHHVERNKERLFEQEIELKWEKGGSGLVFYTDAQYWDAEKGDFDERTADDWDVDMSIYTDPTAGDKDARDFMLMRQEKRRRQGKEDTDMFTAGVGKFEQHTKGFGRKVMEKQGWKEGAGLGRSSVGISEALDNDGQKPYDKKGIGYLGEKLRRKGSGFAKRSRQNEDFMISTIYDNPAETDPPEPLYRSNDHHHLTYRQSFVQGETFGGREKS